MELSHKTEYALLAMLSLATHYHDNEPQQIRQIAAEQNIPNRYLDQLLAELRRGGLICSERGAKGGYWLAQAPHQITVLAIVNCIEGIDSQTIHNRNKPQKNENAVISEVWQTARQAANKILQQYTLQDLLEEKKLRQSSIMYYI